MGDFEEGASFFVLSLLNGGLEILSLVSGFVFFNLLSWGNDILDP